MRILFGSVPAFGWFLRLCRNCELPMVSPPNGRTTTARQYCTHEPKEMLPFGCPGVSTLSNMQLMRRASSSGVTNGLHSIVSCSAVSQILELSVSKRPSVILLYASYMIHLLQKMGFIWRLSLSKVLIFLVSAMTCRTKLLLFRVSQG